MASYSMVNGKEVSYNVSENGEATVCIKSAEPLKPRAVYFGIASLKFMWVHTGKTTTWQFTPRILDPTPIQYTQTKAEDNQSEITEIKLDKLYPATGLIQTNLTGEIKAPAIHFDLPYAFDLWVIMLHSKQAPFKLEIEKPTLSIRHDSAHVILQVSSIHSKEDGDSLRADAIMRGKGFKNIFVSIKRNVNGLPVEQPLGEITDTTRTFSWKPTTKTFDMALITSSTMTQTAFLDFLKHLGAQTSSGTWRQYLQNDFILSDGAEAEYMLSVKGRKSLLGHEDDTTRVTLKP